MFDTVAELLEKIRLGEDSGIEFKQELPEHKALDSMSRQLNRKKFLELRGERVKIILRESKALHSREPVYKLHGKELLLTIFAAKPPIASTNPR